MNTETMQDLLRHDIKIKLHTLFKVQKKVYIKTRHSAKFPRGKFFNGYITDLNKDCVSINDDVDGLLDIYYSEIASPADIEESRRV